MPTKKRKPKKVAAKRAPKRAKAAPKKRVAKKAPAKKSRVVKWVGPALGVKKRRVGMGPHHRKAVRVEPAHKGALHRQLHIPMDEKIPMGVLREAAHAPGKLGQRARMAVTMRGFKHKGK